MTIDNIDNSQVVENQFEDVKSEGTKISKDQLKLLLRSASRESLESFLIPKIMERQTTDELETKATKDANGMGLNSHDAPIITKFHNLIMSGNHLDSDQVNYARKLLPKYAGQYLEILSYDQIIDIVDHPKAESKKVSVPSSNNFASQDEVNQTINSRSEYAKVFVPPEYEINLLGLWKKEYEKVGKDGSLTIIPAIKLCDIHIIVTGRYKSNDGQYYVEITFNDNSEEQNIVIVPQSAILIKEDFKEYLIKQHNIRIEDKKINDVISYLDACITENETTHSPYYKKGYVFTVGDWTDTTFTKFVSGSRLFCEEVINGKTTFIEHKCSYIDVENTHIDRNLTINGDMYEWVRYVKDVAKYIKVRFGMYHALDIILAEMLGVNPCTFAIIFETSRGKTFLLMICASLIGDPNDNGSGLIISGDITKTALFAKLRAFKGHTIFIDEANMSEDLKKTIGYVAFNKQEPSRGKTDGKLRDNKPLNSNIQMASENPIISDKASDGSPIRIINLQSQPMPILPDKVVRQTKEGIKQNYGFILPLFLNKISEHRNKLKGWFEEAITRLQNDSTDTKINRQASLYALAEVSGRLLEEVFRDIGITPTDPTKVVDVIWNECVIGNKNVPLAVKAAIDIYEYARSHPADFLVDYDNPIKGQKNLDGWWVHPEGKTCGPFEFLDLNRTQIKRLLKLLGYDDPTKILKYWKEHDITICNGKKGDSEHYFKAPHYYQYNDKTTTRDRIIRLNIEKFIEIDPKDTEEAVAIEKIIGKTDPMIDDLF